MTNWRLGPGPVFTAELVRLGRRWQTYALRSLTLLGILLAMAVVQSLRVVPPGASMGFKGNAALGAQLFEVFAIAEMVLVLFVAPGMSAGILIPERNRGTLFHVLMTDLSAPEIVLAKYAGRVVPILALLAAAFPLTAILVLLGGIDPLRVIALAMLLAAYAILIPATFLLLSLFLKRVADLLSLGYLIISLWSVLPIIGGWGARLPDPFGRFINDYSPFYLVSYVAGFGPTTGFGGVVEFLVASIALAAFCLAFVAARLRAMTVAEADRGAERKPRRWRLLRAVRGREPDLDARPILWLEWARNRRGLALWLYRLTLFVGVGIADIWLLTNLYDANTPARVPSVLVLAVTLPVSHLLVLVGLAGQFAEDRQNRHFEMLGVTNLEPREILRDRSASASRLCVVAAILASTYTALLMAPEPALGFAATLMMATTAYCLARFSVSLGQWSALRFEKPWTGVVCGVAVLAFLNFAFFLMAMVLGPGGNDNRLPDLAAAIVIACVAYGLGIRIPVRPLPVFKAIRIVFAVAAAFAAWFAAMAAAFAGQDHRQSSMMLLIQTSPFGAVITNALVVLERRFLEHSFAAINVIYVFALAAGWALLALRLDHGAARWLEGRMRDGAPALRPAEARQGSPFLSELQTRLRRDSAG